MFLDRPRFGVEEVYELIYILHYKKLSNGYMQRLTEYAVYGDDPRSFVLTLNEHTDSHLCNQKSKQSFTRSSRHLSPSPLVVLGRVLVKNN